MTEQENQTNNNTETQASNVPELVELSKKFQEENARLKKTVEDQSHALNAMKDQLLNSNAPASTEVAQEKASISELRQKLFKPNERLTNLEFWETALELREAIIEEGGQDMFADYSSVEASSEDAKKSAQRTADCIKQAIEECDGNSKVFTAKLDDILKDSVRLKPRK